MKKLIKKNAHILSILMLFLIWSCKDASHCTIDQNNAGKQQYDADEAACFIKLQLKDKAPGLELIHNALFVEEQYMRKIGLLFDEKTLENESQSSTELNIDELIQFALNEENLGLSKDQLIDIYTIETEYLRFIGVVD